MEQFVRPGEKVVIKPNCAWDRTPEQAANSDPELVAELVRLALAAGAASVVVADSTCHAPGRAFTRSGIDAATRAVGGRTAHQEDSETVRLDLGGTQLGPWEVLQPLAEADRVINVPVVKHHSLARVTLGMKNWIGALVGNRSQLHQRLSQVTAELGAAFKPTLTVIDATRIMTGGGPTGGSLALVESLDRIAVATDPLPRHRGPPGTRHPRLGKRARGRLIDDGPAAQAPAAAPAAPADRRPGDLSTCFSWPVLRSGRQPDLR
jgi:uncharacterized protein (DUF362 family)